MFVSISTLNIKNRLLTIYKEENAFTAFIQDKPKKSTNTNHLQYTLICSDVSGIHKGNKTSSNYGFVPKLEHIHI